MVYLTGGLRRARALMERQMAFAKRKAVINADADHVRQAEALVRAGRYRSLSDLVREAMAEKLERLRRAELHEQVSRYCSSGCANEDKDLIVWQVADGARHRAKR